jgi:hypothetical protein
MRRDREERQGRRHSARPDFATDTQGREPGERMGLDTPVVLAVNDGYQALRVSTRAGL